MLYLVLDICVTLITYLTVIWLLFSGSAVATLPREHAIYVSVLEINQVDNVTGTIKLKIFADDLEDAIKNHSGRQCDLLQGDCTSCSIHIENYLSEHLMLEIEGQKIDYSFVECERNDVSLWITFNFTYKDAWNTILITADYLIELFPTQSNIVSVTKGTAKRMIRLQKGATTEQITL